jgi:hypothetical protein
MRHSPHIPSSSLACLALCAGWVATPAHAQLITVDMPVPTLDRWMYPFASTPGAESFATTFGAILQDGFDDRDAQVLLGFNTGALVPTGLPLVRYQLRSLRVTARVSNDMVATYDNSFDSVTSLYADTDPLQTPDADPGKPVELFGVGYRNNQSTASFLENTAFSTVPPFPPTEGVRSAVAAAFDPAGQLFDLSRQVRQRVDAAPWAIGATTTLQPGDLMPAGTELAFNVDLCAPGVRQYFREALAAGKIRVMVTSLEPASGGPGGGTGNPEYPGFYMKEDPVASTLGWTATLHFVVKVGSLADMNADDGVTIDDLLLFLGAFEEGSLEADVDGDCGVTIDDLLLFLVAFEAG